MIQYENFMKNDPDLLFNAVNDWMVCAQKEFSGFRIISTNQSILTGIIPDSEEILFSVVYDDGLKPGENGNSPDNESGTYWRKSENSNETARNGFKRTTQRGS